MARATLGLPRLTAAEHDLLDLLARGAARPVHIHPRTPHPALPHRFRPGAGEQARAFFQVFRNPPPLAQSRPDGLYGFRERRL